MVTTSQIRALVQSVPANKTLGLEVLQTDDGFAQVAVTVPTAMTGVTGSLHTGGLVDIVDAAGLAAILSTCPKATPARNVVPTGAAAVFDFLAPAHGRLIGSCSLSEATRTTLRQFWFEQVHHVKIMAFAAVSDTTGEEVCRASFGWSLHRDLARSAARELHVV